MSGKEHGIAGKDRRKNRKVGLKKKNEGSEKRCEMHRERSCLLSLRAKDTTPLKKTPRKERKKAVAGGAAKKNAPSRPSPLKDTGKEKEEKPTRGEREIADVGGKESLMENEIQEGTRNKGGGKPLLGRQYWDRKKKKNRERSLKSKKIPGGEKSQDRKVNFSRQKGEPNAPAENNRGEVRPNYRRKTGKVDPRRGERKRRATSVPGTGRINRSSGRPGKPARGTIRSLREIKGEVLMKKSRLPLRSVLSQRRFDEKRLGCTTA